jgi:hypothetical protein
VVAREQEAGSPEVLACLLLLSPAQTSWGPWLSCVVPWAWAALLATCMSQGK